MATNNQTGNNRARISVNKRLLAMVERTCPAKSANYSMENFLITIERNPHIEAAIAKAQKEIDEQTSR